MNDYWGYHLMLDCCKCSISAVTNPENITDFAKTLVERIDMVAYGEPQVVHFGKEEKTGYTLIQLIETSNIAAHFIDQNGDAYIDVFSCKRFDVEVVKATVAEFFELKFDAHEAQSDIAVTREIGGQLAQHYRTTE